LVLRPKHLRALLALYYAALLAVIAVYLRHNAKTLNAWGVAEWLINYADGFVRRGLLGQILLGLSHALHAPIFWVTVVVQGIAFAAAMMLALTMTRSLRWSFAWLALLLSPAVFAFPVLDPPAAIKKEFLYFVLLGLIVLRLRFWPRVSVALVAAITACALALSLSHEVALMYTPYLYVPLFFVEQDWKRVMRWMVVPAILLAVTAGLVAHYPGRPETAEAVCRSLNGPWPPTNSTFCGGAIESLSVTLKVSIKERRFSMGAYHYARVYGISGVLALLPVALVWLRLRRRGDRQRELRWLALAAGMSAVASWWLFYVALDWGRWIHMHVVSLMFLLLLLDRDPERPAEEGPGLEFGARTAIPAAAVVLYATLWTLPALAMYQARMGSVDLVRYVRSYSK